MSPAGEATAAGPATGGGPPGTGRTSDSVAGHRRRRGPWMVAGLVVLGAAVTVGVSLAARHHGGPPARSTGVPAGHPSTGRAPGSPSTVPATGGRGTTVPVPPGPKPVLAGLIIMPPQNGLPERPTPFPVVDPSAYGADTAGFVGTAVDVEWRQLEPAPGQYDWRALDANLAAVSQYNAAHPGHTLGVKVRIFPGFVAPGWAKDLGGAPVTVPLANGRTNTVGHWWSPAYEAAWSTFLHAAAARYDANPLVDGVQVSSCSAITDEPFIMSPLEATALRAAGLTVPAYEHCLSDVFDDYSGWRQTPVYFPINGMPMTAHGSTFAMQIADQCATSASNGGVRCVIDNHGLGSPSGRGAWLYTTIDQLHQQSPGTTYVALQPYGPHDGPDCPAIAAAIAAHAQSVELWAPVPGGYPGFAADSPTTLATWTADLRSGTAPTC